MNTDSLNNDKIAQLVCEVMNTKHYLAERGNRIGRFAVIKWGPRSLNHVYVDDQQIVAVVQPSTGNPVRWDVTLEALKKNETPLSSARNALLLSSAKALLDSVVTSDAEKAMIQELESFVRSEA